MRAVPLAERFWAKVKRGDSSECWPFTGCISDGYGMIRADCSRTMLKAHRVAYELAIGPIPDGQEVLHTCDNPPCCNPGHLCAGTHADNMADMARKGRATGRGLPGEGCHAAKLTDQRVRIIRSGEFLPEVCAAAFGVKKRTILDALSRKTWSHLP